MSEDEIRRIERSQRRHRPLLSAAEYTLEYSWMTFDSAKRRETFHTAPARIVRDLLLITKIAMPNGTTGSETTKWVARPTLRRT